MLMQIIVVVEIIPALDTIVVVGTVDVVLPAGLDGVEIAVAGAADDVEVRVVSVLHERAVVGEVAVASGTVGHD